MPAPAAASFPGPDALGRGLVVISIEQVPPSLAAAPRILVDAEVLAHPRAAAAVLFHHWLHRRRVVIELAVANDELREPEVLTSPPWALSSDVELSRERLHSLVWANTYDLRSGVPIWWHGELARRRTSAELPSTADADGDVVLPDGRAAWVDGGPRGPLATPLPPQRDLPIVHRESIALGRLTVSGDGPLSDGTDLAPDQLAAVTHTTGPARIIAPAGAGKTRVLSGRVAHLLADRHVEPELVTVVAYNRRAAEELRTRLPQAGRSVRTLHSLALWICGLDTRREVIGERDVRAILDGLVRTPRVPNQDPHQPLLEALSDVRMALRDPAEVEATRGDVDGLPDVFDAYRRELERRGALDFDEQVYRAIELLLTRPDIRRRAQQRATHLLVDEFQDLTPAFLLLLRLLAEPTLQVFVVGDDDQTIYSYAGASPDFLVDTQRWFPGVRAHALEVNYRCPALIVEAAVNLLSHNRRRVPKSIRSGCMQQDPATEILRVHAVEAATMAHLTTSIIGDGLDVTDPTQLAVLTRVNSALLPVQIALTEAGIPHTGPLDATVLGRTGVRTVLAYLRLGLDPDQIRREDLLETLNRPARKVKSAVTPLLGRARTSFTELEQLADGLDQTARERFRGYLGDVRLLARAIRDGAHTHECLRLIRDRIGLGEAMDSLDASRRRPEGSSHADDLDALTQLADLHPDPATFQGWLTDRLRTPADPAGVTLSSVHRVKGMQWERVVIFAANNGLFPHRLADDVEEERRVFHVALTRASRRVDVIADTDRCSPFVEELGRGARRDRHTAATTSGAASTPARPSRSPSAASAPAASGPERSGPAVSGAAASSPATSGPAMTDGTGTVIARKGEPIELIGGAVGHVVATDRAGITVEVAAPDPGDPPIRFRLPVGASVRHQGRAVALTAPRRGRPPGRSGPDPARTAGDASDTAVVDEALFEALRVWRARTAAETGVPAYIVLSDRHLREIAARRPDTLDELSSCPGIGPTKLDRYGDDLLALIDTRS